MTNIDELRDYYDNDDTSADLERAERVPADAPAASDRMTTFAVRLPVPVLERVRELAVANQVTTSALLRQWIDAGIRAAESSERAGDTSAIDAYTLHLIIDALASRDMAGRAALGALLAGRDASVTDRDDCTA